MRTDLSRMVVGGASVATLIGGVVLSRENGEKMVKLGKRIRKAYLRLLAAATLGRASKASAARALVSLNQKSCYSSCLQEDREEMLPGATSLVRCVWVGAASCQTAFNVNRLFVLNPGKVWDGQARLLNLAGRGRGIFTGQSSDDSGHASFGLLQLSRPCPPFCPV